jgi:hypothetical protein
MRTKKKVAKKPSPEELDKEREQRAESFKAELDKNLQYRLQYGA